MEITAPETRVVLIEAAEEIVAVVHQQRAMTIEVRRGPAGPTGATGPEGPSGEMLDGVNTGDIIRWNAVTLAWESAAEPFEFAGIVLVPMALPGGVVAEGFVGYNAVDKGIYVQID